MFTTLDEAEVHATPNATMRRYPGREVAVWRTEMEGGAAGPVHRIDVDQVVVVVEGSAAVRVEGTERTLVAGDATLVPAGAERQVVAGVDGCVTLGAARPGGLARVGDGSPVEVPWAR